MSGLQTAANIASITVAVAAVFGLIIAIWQILQGRRITQEATAYKLFADFLDRSLAFPDLSDPLLARSYTKRQRKWNRCYFAFVSSMLFSFEEMLKVSKNDKEWRIVIKFQLRNYKHYLSDQTVFDSLKTLYTSNLMSCISDVINETSIDTGAPSAGLLADQFAQIAGESQNSIGGGG